LPPAYLELDDSSSTPEPKAPLPVVKQLDWDDFTKMANIDRGKHPEHWRNAPQTEAPLSWLLK
jgi:hypothetical protein